MTDEIEKAPLGPPWSPSTDATDVSWVTIPFSKAEMRRLAPDRGVLTATGTFWEEIRQSLGLPSKPYRYTTGSHQILQPPHFQEVED